MYFNYKIKAYVITNKGLIRDSNEDNFYVNGRYMNEAEGEGGLEFFAESTKYNQIFAVCDGMGGEAEGELASFIAAKALESLAVDIDRESDGNIAYKISAINKYVYSTNLYLCELMQKDIKGRMGSTLSGIHLFGDDAITFNIGDSRVYIFRNNKLYQLTLDHTEAQRLIRLGVIDEEQAKQHKSKHQLTRHFGILTNEGVLTADISDKFKIQKDDIFLLCSDGLTDMLSDTDIKQILIKTENIDAVHSELAKEALKQGGHDNITIIILKVCQEERILE